MMNNKSFKTFILVIIDFAIVAISAFLALALRFDIQNIPSVYLMGMVRLLPVYMIIVVAIFTIFKLYNRIWTYASSKELFDIIKASIIIEALIIGIHVFTETPMPRSYYPLHFLIFTVITLMERFLKLFVIAVRGKHPRSTTTNRIMAVGAGAACSILIQELDKPESTMRIVCAIDDNQYKNNKTIRGVPIVGTRDDICKAAEKFHVDSIFITMPSAHPKELKDIINICQKTELPIKILPSIAKSATESVVNSLRPIQYEDLLGRDPVHVDQTGIAEFMRDKVIMVTGGGGSIGSELCRQIAKYDPRRLIIFDIYENNAYSIQMELETHFPDLEITVLIGSVRDYDRLETIFQKYKPEIIYHAAAHKHVPLMEKSPNEAIKNNCQGTLNMVKLADKYRCESFVMISTDKAVRPTSLMGASKRICEMIVQTYAHRSKHTKFASVRFGNVLGSNGSVIPLFLKQIEEGGPVTVTHKEIRRFFMTIPEAVSLVIQAGIYANGGEIFVLDMGKPVKIYDLAENLIRMKGLKPGKDIQIEIIGLRPGEKLYEEVLMDEEGLETTQNDMIFIGKPIAMDEEKFLSDLDKLIDESYKNGHHIKEMTETICSTYHITDNN